MAEKEKLPKESIKDLTLEDIDKLSHEALKAAVKSVIRLPSGDDATHKDHRSHSSTQARIFESEERPQ